MEIHTNARPQTTLEFVIDGGTMSVTTDLLSTCENKQRTKAFKETDDVCWLWERSQGQMVLSWMTREFFSTKNKKVHLQVY